MKLVNRLRIGLFRLEANITNLESVFEAAKKMKPPSRLGLN